jgi:membrane fusion protein
MPADDPSLFLDDRPAPWAASGLAWVLLALLATLAVALVVVHVPETVDAPFVVVARRGADPIRVLHDGVISAVRVVESQAVAARAPLFVIDSAPVTDRSSERQSLATLLSGGGRRLANERNRDAALRRADEQERLRLLARLEGLERQASLKARELTLAREVAQRQEQSYREGLSAWVQASVPRLAADRIELELQQIQADTAETQGMLARLAYEATSRRLAFAETERGIQEELTRHEARKLALEREPGHGGGALVLGAPCDATVVTLHVKNSGTVVHAGDVLAEVVCTGERLEAQLMVPQRGLALVRPGQTVKLLYEAFPYERYGARYATLRWVSPMSGPGAERASFRALADLDEDAMAVQGQRRPVLPGMAGRAAVIVGRRSLVSYAFEPLRQVREAMAGGRGR